MKVVVAVDSFKGSLDSLELGKNVRIGIQKVYPKSEIKIVPVADGGEGTVEAMVEGTKGMYIDIEVHDPLMRKVKARYGILGDKKTAIIEMASASGLPLLSVTERNPWETTTYGTGELIRDAISRGCREFILGIGGSATNDGGLGMARALGYKFYDIKGQEVGHCGKDMQSVTRIDSSGVLKELKKCKIMVACDVDNPFFGENGAAYIYAKQKGAFPKMIKDLDEGLKHLAKIYEKTFGKKIGEVEGAGAAGGLGGGMVAFLNGTLKPGVEIILEKVNLERALKGADFVITGEGKIDNQTIMGKTPVGVAKLAKKYDIPVIAIAGMVTDDAKITHDYGIDAIFSIINYPVAIKDALKLKRTKIFVQKNIEEIFRVIKVCESRLNKESIKNQ